jgi:pimeloyl-ACP methyl ester carboxylesterase
MMVARRLLLALLAGVIASATPTGQAAEIAASIQYDFVAPPAGLSADFQPREGISLRYLTIKAIDGIQLDAALWQPNRKPPSDTTLVVMVPGNGGGYRRAPESALGARLPSKGYAVLAINNRQTDAGNTDNFFDVRRDIEAAVYTSRALGYRNLVLQGYSLGNIQVQFYAATNWDPDIKAVVLLSAFGNLPWRTRFLLVQSEDTFRRFIDAAMQSLRDGTLGKMLPDLPVTGQHFLTYQWDKTSVADGTFWIHRIPMPILLVRDHSDGIIQPFEPDMLLAAARDEGSLVPHVDYVLLPDAQPISPKGHYFDGNEQPLADVITKWLGERHL